MQDEMNDLQYTQPEDPDIVRVVRCKDCAFFHREEWGSYCGQFEILRPEEIAYCSYGERKDEVYKS